MANQKNTPIIYQAENGAIELRGDANAETIWATQKQMAEVFSVNVRTINEHIKNIFSDDELYEDSVVRKFRITAADGKKYNTNHYNLDMIISVGYRVNSKTATQFRKWSTSVLRQHITQGYTINEKLLKQKESQYLQATIASIKRIDENISRKKPLGFACIRGVRGINNKSIFQRIFCVNVYAI